MKIESKSESNSTLLPNVDTNTADQKKASTNNLGREVPKTGEESNDMFVYLLMAGFLAVLVVVSKKRKTAAN